MTEDKGLKQFLIVFNVIVVLSGLAIAGLGIWLIVDSDSFSDIVDSAALSSANYALIGVGAFIALVGFCGCCGAWTEVKILLVMYIIVVGIVFVVEVAAGIAIALYQTELETFIEKTMNSTLQEDYGQSGATKEALTDAWDTLQKAFDCCGVSMYTDYETSAWYNASSSRAWPESCCVYSGDSILDETKCYTPSASDWYDYMNTGGCYNEIRDLITNNIMIVGAVLVGFSVIILSTLCGAVCLCCSIRKD